MRRYEKSRLSPAELLDQAGGDKLEYLTKIIRAVGKNLESIYQGIPQKITILKRVYSTNVDVDYK